MPDALQRAVKVLNLNIQGLVASLQMHEDIAVDHVVSLALVATEEGGISFINAGCHSSESEFATIHEQLWAHLRQVLRTMTPHDSFAIIPTPNTNPEEN